uniref:hypothetical protein n=1 Tax=Roseovarius salis TaxID=3376063 RepID=UPI0037CB93CA
MTNDADVITLRPSESSYDPLSDITLDVMRRKLAIALRAAAAAFVAQHAEGSLPDGCQRVVRHGFGLGGPSRPGSAL